MEKEKIDYINQVKDYLQSNFLGFGFQELKDVVISKNNCILCGTCSTLCPRIEANDKEPILLEYDPECSTCFRFCPRTYYPKEIFDKELFKGAVNKSYSLGFYQKIQAAKAIDNNVLKFAQNGGVVSSLLIHALDTGLIDGALLTSRDDNLLPQPVIARTAEEILSCTGSKYTIAPSLSIYRDAVNKFKLEKLAFVGMPCQIQAVRKLQLFSPLSKEYGKFTLVIGLYCYSNYSYDLMKTFVQEELGIPLNEVSKIDISKGKFCVYQNNGSVKKVSVKETKKYNWMSCQYCKDYTAEYADISVGSVGVIQNDWNSVILRTNTGVELFNDAVKNNKIVTSDDLRLEKIEQEALRKKTQIPKIDDEILSTMRYLNASENEIKTYMTIMSLGHADEPALTRLMNMEDKAVRSILIKLKNRNWIEQIDGVYSSMSPKLVITNEINLLRKNFMEKIEKLKTDVLPRIETIYVQNNHARHDENLDII
ncbi:MAG: Coenzyme F420 hydrogenase/dehydrogenase, beta subunit C-terminal domain [Candidatus Thorarchaeota archaeon]